MSQRKFQAAESARRADRAEWPEGGKPVEAGSVAEQAWRLALGQPGEKIDIRAIGQSVGDE